MKVHLGNDVVLELYCCVRQAALSLDRALSPADWPALLDYYDLRRRSWIGSIVHGLESTAESPHQFQSEKPERPRNAGMLSIGFARIIGRFRRSIVLSSDNTRFFVETLENLLKLLNSKVYPGMDTLIALRLDLSAGEALLNHKAGSMTGLARCQMIEHLNQAPHLATISVANIVPTADQRPVREAQAT